MFKTALEMNVKNNNLKIAVVKHKQADSNKENNANISHNHFIFSNSKYKLNGINYLVKDSFWTVDLPTTASSNFLTSFISGEDATVVKLLSKEGAICKGKVIMDEFACGGTGLTSNSGEISNPYNSEHITGGSSSGSAESVAKKLVPFALGSDTGGSARQPAAYCGIIGFKPSHGLVSRYGLIPMASSLDTVGILADSVATTQKVFSVISRPDPADLLTIATKQIKAKSVVFSNAKKIAILKNVENYLSLKFTRLYKNSLAIFKQKGYQITAIEIPSDIRDNLQIAYLIICSSELASHLNSCQGITYGQKLADKNGLEQETVSQIRNKYLGKSVKQRLLLGSYFLQNKSDCEKAYNFKQKVKKWSNKIFRQYDFLIFPSTNSEAPKIKHSTFFSTGSELHWSDNLLLLASLGGFPSLSLPIGFVNNLPVGININSDFKQDNLVFKLAKLLERESEFYKKG